MPLSIADLLPTCCGRHKNRRQQLLWVVGYSTVFCLVAFSLLNHSGYLGGRHAPHPAQGSAQLILRRVIGDHLEEEPHRTADFMFKGSNASVQTLSERTQRDDVTKRAGKLDTRRNESSDEKKERELAAVGRTRHERLGTVLGSPSKISKDERTGESVAEENAALKTDPEKFIFRPKPFTVQYYHSVIDHEPFTNRYNTCAIVSSSGQLLGKNAGPEIDSADAVIRMNAAPVKGFEKDVGSRTTIRVACFISSNHITSQAESILKGMGAPETVLFWGLEAPKSRKKAQSIPKVTSLQRRFMEIKFFSHSNDGELSANRLFERETGASRLDTNSWLSTGWFTVMTALDICGEVRIYGMVPDDHCVHFENEKVKYHYYQPGSSPSECTYYKVHEATPKGGHRFMTEKAIFARWAQHYNLTFVHPTWNRSAEEAAKKIDTPFTKLFHLKGLKYFQRGGRSRGGKDTTGLVLGMLLVLGIPALFIIFGTIMATCVDGEQDISEYRQTRRQRNRNRLH